MPIGAFPGMDQVNRRTIRGPINPMDKSTIVSILPKVIDEKKPTMYPGVFHLPAGSIEEPSVLVVGPSSWWREIDETQPLLEIPVASISVANSIVLDYCNGLLGCDMNTRMPGLFYLPGEFNLNQIQKEHAGLLHAAHAKQRNWFMELVRIADILWSRSNGNPLSISDDARLAARELNLSNKPWLNDTHTMELIRCIACGNMRNPNYPICQTCKAIADPELAEKLNLTFAK